MPKRLSTASPTTLLDIVIPVYGQIGLLEACLKTVFEHTRVPYTVILVDDNSPIHSCTREFMGRFAHDRRVTCISNLENQGFGETCNRGASLGDAPFICFLNSDTEVTPSWDTGLLASFSLSRSIAAVGPKLLYPSQRREPASGSLPRHLAPIAGKGAHPAQPSRPVLNPADHPRGTIIQSAGLAIHRASGKPYDPYTHRSEDHPPANRRTYVPAVTGACMIVRRDRFRGFDPLYVKGCFEDVDLCLDFYRRRYKVLYEPTVTVYHHQGASYNHSESSRNLSRFVDKWRGRRMPPNAQDLPDSATLPPPPEIDWTQPVPAIYDALRGVRKEPSDALEH